MAGAITGGICGAGYVRPLGTPKIVIVEHMGSYHVCIRRGRKRWWEIVADTRDPKIAQMSMRYLKRQDGKP